MQLTSGGLGTSGQQNRLPVNNVACLFVRWERPSVARCQIFQQFNSRSACGAQSSDAQSGSKHIVQMLLLGSIVLALSGHMHSEQVAVELDTGVAVPHYDCCMVDTEKQLIGG